MGSRTERGNKSHVAILCDEINIKMNIWEYPPLKHCSAARCPFCLLFGLYFLYFKFLVCKYCS